MKRGRRYNGVRIMNRNKKLRGYSGRGFKDIMGTRFTTKVQAKRSSDFWG